MGKRVRPHAHAHVVKRLRCAHREAVNAAERAQTMALYHVVCPLLSLSVLQASAVTPVVAAHYDQSLTELILWLSELRVTAIRTMEGLDVALVRYFDRQCAMLTPFSVGEKLLAALGHRTPHLAGSLSVKFPGASRSMRGWRRLHLARTRPPLPWLAVLVIASSVVAQGLRTMALAVLILGFADI